MFNFLIRISEKIQIRLFRSLITIYIKLYRKWGLRQSKLRTDATYLIKEMEKLVYEYDKNPVLRKDKEISTLRNQMEDYMFMLKQHNSDKKGS